MIMIVSFIIIVGALFGYLFYQKKGKILLVDPIVSCRYKCECGNFNIIGKKSSFVVDKNGRFEFLIKDGRIIACKDKSKASEFVYYEGVK